MRRISLRPRSLRHRPPGPKPLRRTELGILIFGAVIVIFSYVLASLGTNSKIPVDLGPFLGVVLGLSIVAHLANRWLAPDANPVVLPIAAILNGLGYVMIVRLDPREASLQAGWTALAVGAYVGTLLLVRRSRDLDRYRYLLLLGGAGLLLLPLVPKIGGTESGAENKYGARLWIHLGHVVQFQPVEVGKLLICIFFASYFSEKRELLSIPTARVGNRLVLDPRPLVPILVAWGFVLLVIGFERDIGFALLLFTMFIAMLWITTGRTVYLLVGIVLFAGGAIGASHLLSQVDERVTVWLDPWKTPQSTGLQSIQALYAMGTGGVGGTGLGLGHPYFVPLSSSDMIFSSFGEEMGLYGTTVIAVAFMLLAGAGFRIAQTARSDFSRLLAVGLTTIIGFQAFFIMAGVTRLLPLTGMALPFLSYGGSSLLANYVLIAILIRVSDEGNGGIRTDLLSTGSGSDRLHPSRRPVAPTR